MADYNSTNTGAAIDAAIDAVEFAKNAISTNAEVGRLLKVRDFGLGGLAVNIGSSSADIALNTGFYSYSNTSTGTPVAGSFGTILATQLDSTAGSQIAVSTSSGQVYSRRRASSVWAAWYVMFDSSNTNFNDFSGSQFDNIAVGVALSASVAIFYLPMNSTIQASSVTVTSTFSIAKPDGSIVASNLGASDIALNIRSSKKVSMLTIGGLTGLTVGAPLELRCATNTSKIQVNF